METQLCEHLNYAGYERRSHLRKHCTLHIDFDDFETCHQGVATNISSGGVFIKTQARNRIGSEVSLTIPYDDYTRYLVINGRVTRTAPEGLGIAFVKS